MNPSHFHPYTNMTTAVIESVDKIVEDVVEIKNMDGLTYLSGIADKSVHLVLTDPPYIISKPSGMNSHYENVRRNESNGIVNVKTTEEWNAYKKANRIDDDTNMDNYLKYGTIYGKKYCVKTDYGTYGCSYVSYEHSFSLLTIDMMQSRHQNT